MLLQTVCTVYFFKDAQAAMKMDNKSPFFNKKIIWIYEHQKIQKFKNDGACKFNKIVYENSNEKR